MLKTTSIFVFSLCVVGCAETGPLDVAKGLFGYTPPPAETTVAEELQLEYDRCMKINSKRNCAQVAYDVVRVVKGLEPRPVPKGIVIILKGDGGHGKGDNESEEKPN
jgi:hypothetical protein